MVGCYLWIRVLACVVSVVMLPVGVCFVGGFFMIGLMFVVWLWFLGVVLVGVGLPLFWVCGVLGCLGFWHLCLGLGLEVVGLGFGFV